MICWPPIALKSLTPFFSTSGGAPAFVMGTMGNSYVDSIEAATMTGTSGVIIGLGMLKRPGNSFESGESSVKTHIPWLTRSSLQSYKNCSRIERVRGCRRRSRGRAIS